MTASAKASTPVVRLNNVTRTYRRGPQVVVAVNDASLDIPARSLILFQGKSGSGKTTLLNLMGGLEKPTSGQVSFRGRDFATFTPAETTRWRRREAGFVFQSFALLPGLTAMENVDLAARICGCGPREARLRAERYLGALGVLARAGHRVAELSGGEQQRVAVARGLVTHPAMVFADEPTGELDHALGRTVMDLLRETVDETGTTICLTSHDPAVRSFADVVYTIVDGRVARREEMKVPQEADA